MSLIGMPDYARSSSSVWMRSHMGSSPPGSIEIIRNSCDSWSSVLLAIGVVLIIAALVYVPETAILLPWLWSLIPIGFSLCLLAAIDLRPPSRLALNAIRWLSTRSYGLHMVHRSTVEATLYIHAK